jgi:uncharacterized protein (UPF0332 family)
MTFDWNEFGKLAEELRHRENEASQRTAISRIYYSVYWRARNLLGSEGYVFRQDDTSHSQIWREFLKRGRTHHGIGKAGNFLKDNRIQADYFPEIENIEILTKDSFELAEKAIFYLQEIEKKTEN